MDPLFGRAMDEIRLHIAERVETVLRPEMDDDPVERAWRMAGYYLALEDLPDDREAGALLRLAAPYLKAVESMPSPDRFWELVEFAHGIRQWEDWRCKTARQLRLLDSLEEEELALARHVHRAGRFDVGAMAEQAVQGKLPYPRVDRILEIYDEIKAKNYIRQELYQLTQRWYRRKPPLLEKVASNVYCPLPEFCDLFEREPALPDRPSWLREAGGGEAR